MEQLVIYKSGETNIQTSITNGFADYTDGKLAIDYVNELGPEFKILPFAQAVELIETEQEKLFINPWIEIKEDNFFENLEILPPEKWQTVKGVNMFRMCEYLTGNITAHYARIGKRYFTASRRTSSSYETLANEVLQEVKPC